MSVVQRLTGRIRPAFQALKTHGPALRSFLSRTARAILGEVDWRAPPWLKWSAVQARSGTRAAIDHARQKPRQTALVVAAAVVVLGGGYAGLRWYENRPRPIETTFTVTSPEAGVPRRGV